MALFSPEDFWNHLGCKDRLPRKAIFTYSYSVYSAIRDWSGTSRRNYPYNGVLMENISEDGGFILLKLLPGSAFTATVAEEIHALGVDEMIILGGAGSIFHGAPMGSLVLCSKALRDEGVSFHYMRKSLYSHPSKEMTSALKRGIAQHNSEFLYGPTWTTDAPYLETVSKIERCQDLGIITVEMEASALFAVSRMRGFHSSAAFIVTDELFGDKWSGMSLNNSGIEKLLEVADLFSKLNAH